MIKPNPPILRLDQLDIPVPFLVLAFCVAYIQGILLNNPPQSLMYAQLGGSHLAMLVPPIFSLKTLCERVRGMVAWLQYVLAERQGSIPLKRRLLRSC